jgi:hypothetical protein
MVAAYQAGIMQGHNFVSNQEFDSWELKFQDINKKHAIQYIHTLHHIMNVFQHDT